MADDEIVTYGREVLRTTAEEVTEIDEEIRGLIQQMCVVMKTTRGLGLAAPQIGVPKRVFVYDVGDGEHAIINPKIVRKSGQEYSVEGCLSIPGLQGDVPRYTRVTVVGLDENGARVKIKAEDLLARVFQHEIDHLDGVMFIDRADPDTLETVPVGEESGQEG